MAPNAQTAARAAELLLNAQQVHRGLGGGGVPGLAVDLAAECLLLQVVEARCTLNVGRAPDAR